MRIAVVLLVAGAVVAFFETTKGQWTLATDVQKYYRCLPFEWYYVENGPVEKPVRGDLVRFEAPEHVEQFDGTFELIKIVAAVAGDSWRIDENELYINGRRWDSLHLITKIGLNIGDLDGEGVIPENEIYVLGTNPSSLDSRYWGTLSVEEINGRAHAIF